MRNHTLLCCECWSQSWGSPWQELGWFHPLPWSHEPAPFRAEPELCWCLHGKGPADPGVLAQSRAPVAEPGEAAGPHSHSAGRSQRAGAQGKEEYKNCLSRTPQGSVEGFLTVSITPCESLRLLMTYHASSAYIHSRRIETFRLRSRGKLNIKQEQ